MDALRLYFRYIAISIRGQLQYRASFIIQSIAHFMVTGFEFLGLVAVFGRFKAIQGWSLAEVGLFYGIISIAFALSESISRGFDVFHRLVRAGDFDRMLLRPRTAAMQVLGQELQLMRIGRLSQALIILILSAGALQVDWTLGRIALLIGAILGGACLFIGLFILQATLSFWTVESLEIANCTTYGGVEAAQFPLTIYRPWLRRFFTFVIPLATINYFPAMAILGRSDPLGTPAILHWLAPLAGVAFLAICLQFWRFGVRHYTSTGS
jgi:ABC-2 type transport system permease protein